jgi:hypothetical protein
MSLLAFLADVGLVERLEGTPFFEQYILCQIFSVNVEHSE